MRKETKNTLNIKCNEIRLSIEQIIVSSIDFWSGNYKESRLFMIQFLYQR